MTDYIKNLIREMVSKGKLRVAATRIKNPGQLLDYVRTYVHSVYTSEVSFETFGKFIGDLRDMKVVLSKEEWDKLDSLLPADEYIKEYVSLLLAKVILQYFIETDPAVIRIRSGEPGAAFTVK